MSEHAPVADRLVQREEEAFARAAQADNTVNSGKHFGDWLAIGDGLLALRDRAMRESGSNSPFGRGYTKHYAKLKNAHAWAGNYDPGTVNHAIWLAEHISEVTRWRDALADKQRKEWVHPRVVRQHYDRATKVPTRKDGTERRSPMAEAKATIIRQQEEIDRLKRMSDEGSLFDLRRDTAPVIARVILNTVGDPKVQQLIKELTDGRKEKVRKRAAHAG